jgi:hypothetical protein
MILADKMTIDFLKFELRVLCTLCVNKQKESYYKWFHGDARTYRKALFFDVLKTIT